MSYKGQENIQVSVLYQKILGKESIKLREQLPFIVMLKHIKT